MFTAMAHGSNHGPHNTIKHFKDATASALRVLPDVTQIAVGLPFYGRSVRNGDRKSYENIVQAVPGGDLTPDIDQL